MKFLVLMTEPEHFDRWDASDDTEQQAVLDAYARFTDAVRARGAVLYGDALARPERARTLQPGAGPDRPVTEGPYAESVEQLGGFYVVEAPTMADVIEATRLLPREYTIEIRPLLDVYQGVTWPLRGR
ncbi:YciI family protein [Occultella gossypii]|uniref:Transcription initiation protein n=1 Tax=Occultella gossypii TaxID=2800820 RepID=A0ABS7SDB4_9MICO|nr:YciI family protein [Occultella gossypii]MBZ2197709.1 transcription initiation protein [Occultella gossypii]